MVCLRSHLGFPCTVRTPEPFLETHSEKPYAGEVAYVDNALGRFLEEMEKEGFSSNTLIVFTADHGEGLGEHGEATHSMFAYESTLHVPLFFTGKVSCRRRYAFQNA